MLKSDIADLNNSAEGGFAGATTAALFLEKFVADGVKWAHFDTFAWRPSAKPGRPKGGEALGLRAVWQMLLQRYGGLNPRSEEHTSELQSLMRISYAVFCLKKKQK